MSMVVIVVRKVVPRIRGYLSSIMLEVAPGVFVAPQMSHQVRRRVWMLMEDWQGALRGALVMTWQDRSHPSGQQVAMLGEPRRTIIDHEGLLLVKRD